MNIQRGEESGWEHWTSKEDGRREEKLEERVDEEEEEGEKKGYPSWFHPPLLLPAPMKQEREEVPDAVGVGEERGEGGSPADLASPQALLDPRHIIHFLTRKVCQLF